MVVDIKKDVLETSMDGIKSLCYSADLVETLVSDEYYNLSSITPAMNVTFGFRREGGTALCVTWLDCHGETNEFIFGEVFCFSTDKHGYMNFTINGIIIFGARVIKVMEVNIDDNL